MALCNALPCLYFSGKYAGSGGSGEFGGGRWMLACERIDDSDGRGARKEGIEA